MTKAEALLVAISDRARRERSCWLRSRANRQRYRDAEATLQRALEAHPKDMDLLNNLNTILVQAKDMAGAEMVARRMIETEPTLFDHRLRLARLFDTQGCT